MLYVLGRTSGFLAELPGRAGGRFLAGVQASGRDLVEVALGGVPVLPNEQELRVVSGRVAQKGDDGTGTGMPHHLELSFAAVREANAIDVEIDDATGVHPPAPQLLRSTHRPPPRLETFPPVGVCTSQNQNPSRSTRSPSRMATG